MNKISGVALFVFAACYFTLGILYSSGVLEIRSLSSMMGSIFLVASVLVLPVAIMAMKEE